MKKKPQLAEYADPTLADFGYHPAVHSNTDGKAVMTKKMEGGAMVTQSIDGYYAYDQSGRYLGFHTNRKLAEQNAVSGKLGHLSSETVIDPEDMLLLWDKSVKRGVLPFQAEDGCQIIQFPFSDHFIVFDPKTENFKIRVMSLEEITSAYGTDYGTWNLTYADEPYRV